jgi:short subunit dehydrogenase-like uncharacterized protein
VLTTVGPYQLYGNELVAACAASGVDYVDLCGEPAWMRQMIDAHEARPRPAARASCSRAGSTRSRSTWACSCCKTNEGQRFGHPAPRVRGRVRKMKGTFSGGTAASLKATMAAAATNPACWTCCATRSRSRPASKARASPRAPSPWWTRRWGLWVAPFVMAAINTRNVHRSNFLLGHAYGADFVYDEMLITGAGEKGEAIANAVAADKSLGSDRRPQARRRPLARGARGRLLRRAVPRHRRRRPPACAWA